MILFIISSISRLIPGFVALVNYHKAPPYYQSFLYLIWLGALNEILGIFFATNGIHTTINNNIYVLAEAILIMLFFYQLAVIKKKTLLAGLVFVLIVGWLLETLLFQSIHQISSYFRMGYSFFTVLLSTKCISQPQMATSVKRLNATFLICTVFIFYYTLKILVEAFWTYGVNLSRQFQIYLFNILVFTNFIGNIIFAVAIYRMPWQTASRQPQAK